MQQENAQEDSKIWTRNFILLTCSNLFVYLNLQMITPALPAYVSQHFGASSFVVSFVISMFAVSAIVTRLFVGQAIAYMNRRHLLLIGIGIFLLSTMTYYWVGIIALIILIRITYGIGFGIMSTTYGTMVSENIPRTRLGEGMGYFGLSTSLSMSIAPVIGLWILGNFGFGTLIFVSTLLVAILIPITFGTKFSVQADKPMNVKHRMKFMDARALLPCMLNILLSITYGGLITFITMLGIENHIQNVGWFFLTNAVAVLLVRPISGRIYDQKGPKAILPFGAVMVILAMILLSYTTSMDILILSSICYGIGYGVLQPSLQAWAIERVSPENRGVANGAFYNSIDLGIAVGSMTLGLIALKTSYAMMYRLSALFMVLFLIIFAISWRRQTQ